MNRAYLLLGSNIDAERNLVRALEGLRRAGRVAAVSPVYSTAPVGRTDQARFLNAAVLLETGMTAEELKRRVIGPLEAALGRVRDPLDKNAPRTIDVDIVLWEPGAPGAGPVATAKRDAAASGRNPTTAGGARPDLDILSRLHVAVPLADLAPDWVHPADGRPLALIAAELTVVEQAGGRAPPVRLPAPPGWSVP